MRLQLTTAPLGMAALLAATAVLCAGCVSDREVAPVMDLSDFVVAGYLPERSVESADPEAGRYVTDVLLFSIEPEASGALNTSRVTPEHIARIQAMRAAYGTRLLICLGGWGRSTGFGPMATDVDTRRLFIANLTRYCLENGFDGADYDWEFPKNEEERDAYSRLIVETKQAFEPHGLLVTAALNKWQALDADAYAALDRIHVMAYDMGVRHATPRASQEAAQRFIREGVPRAKVCLGVPFYGRRIDKREIAATYANILREFSPDPGADEAGGYYFNGVATIRLKTRYAIDQRLNGIMIWELGQDTHDDTSLLRAIYDEVAGR
ncbi:MAG: hypothetical protein GWP08_19630 [Nitrospiraceae bacterium]|nr:hypothetical protein [Nitrospiraceae bacterium]